MPPIAPAAFEAKYAAAVLTARSDVKSEYNKNACPKVDITKFTPVTLLGKGAFARVFKARNDGCQEVEASIVAIKTQFKKGSKPERVVNEKRFLYALKNQFMLHALGCAKDVDKVYLVLDYAPHGEFTGLIESIVPESTAKFYVGQLVLALEYVHAANIIYADLKPPNILVFGGGRLKLSDFGLSVFARDDLRLSAGTPTFMAPEIFEETSYTDAVDWWALGVLTCMMLGGKHPFLKPNDDLESFQRKVLNLRARNLVSRYKISRDAKDLICGLLDKDLSARLGSIRNGVEGVKRHPWFKNFSFGKLLAEDFAVSGFQSPEMGGTKVNISAWSEVTCVESGGSAPKDTEFNDF